MSWWSSRSSNGLYWSYTIVKSPYKGIIENQEIWKVGLSETHASGNREASTHNNWWKANWWNKYQQEGSRQTWNDEVWDFFKLVLYMHSPNPDDELRNLFVKMVMKWWMFTCFFSRHFSYKFFRGSYTCSSNYSVYDGECTHTHLSHAHFSVAQFVCAHSHICMHVHTRMAQVSPKRCVIPLHLAVSLLMIHPSSLFPHVHFETNPDYDFIDKPIHMILPYFSRPESARHAQLRSCIRCKQRLWAPKVRQDHTISPTSRIPRTITLDNSVFPQCLNPLFRTCLTRKHAIGKPLLDSDIREKSTEQKKELFSSDAHEISLWRVTENPILKSHRKSYSDGWDLWEHLRRRVQQAFFSGISKTTVLGRYSMDRSSSAREYILRRELEMKDHLHQERYARRCQAIEKLKGCWYHEGNYKKKKPKIEIISYTAWSGITNSEPIFLRSWLTQQLWRTHVPHQALITSSSR